jgi:hypothetical protein
MTEKSYGPGFIDMVLGKPCDPNGSQEDNQYDQFKQPVRTESCSGHIQFLCGECNFLMPEHDPLCPVHLQYKKSEEQWDGVEYKHPEGQCKGCPSPIEGPHTFSCAYGGIKASQVVLPVTRQPDGTFSVDPPYSNKRH